MAELKVKSERRRVREMSDEEIGIEVRELRDRLFRMRSQMVTDRVEKTSEFRRIRRQVARLLTEGRRRALMPA